LAAAECGRQYAHLSTLRKKKKKKKKKKKLDGAAPSARQIVAPAKNRKEPRCATPHHQCFTIHLSRLSKKKSWLRPKKMSFRVLFRKKNVLSCPELIERSVAELSPSEIKLLEAFIATRALGLGRTAWE
jgi:hypothetical protein